MQQQFFTHAWHWFGLATNNTKQFAKKYCNYVHNNNLTTSD
jgi:hypothetical protein